VLFPRNPELAARLVATPDDDEAYLVYGDWLQDRGSPHGELIHVQRALRAAPHDIALRRREAELLEVHGPELVGALLVPQIKMLGWHGGFVRRAVLTADELLELTTYPAGLLLRELDVDGEWTLQPVIDRLAAAPPTLVALRLGISTKDADLSHEIGELGGIWRAQPRLARLVVEDGALGLGVVASRSLRELVLRPTTLTTGNLRSLAEASLPALEHLELWLEHDDGYGYPHRDRDRWAQRRPRCSIRLEEVHHLLGSLRWPSLRHLHIANTTLGDALCDVLVRSPLRHQLTSLALTRGRITDAGAALLASNLDAFPRLERIDLDHNRIATRALLDALPSGGMPGIQNALGPR